MRRPVSAHDLFRASWRTAQVARPHSPSMKSAADQSGANLRHTSDSGSPGTQFHAQNWNAV